MSEMRVKTYPSLKNRGVFTKFFLSVLLVSTVSVLILSGLVSYWLYGKMLSDIGQVKKTEMQITAASFENHVETARRFSMSLYQNPLVKSVMLSGDTQWSSSFSYVVSHIKSILSVNRFINSIYIVNTGGVVCLIANDTESEASQQELVRMVQSEEFSVGDPVAWDMTATNGNKRPTLTVFFREGLDSGGFDGALAVNIDLGELRDSIFSASGAAGQETMIVDTAGNTVLQSTLGSSPFGQRSYAQRILGGANTEDSFRMQDHKLDVLVSYVPADGGRFLVVSETAYQSGASELIQGGNLLVAACVVIILLLISVSWVVSCLVYKPVGRVFSSLRTLFPTADPDDQKADEARVMTNTLQKIADRMNSLEQQQVNHAITAFLCAAGPAAQPLTPRYFVDAGVISAPGEPYLLCVLRIDGFRSFAAENNSEARSFQVNTVCTLAAEYFQDTCLCNAYQTADDCIALILSGKTQGPTDWPQSLQKMIRDMLGLEISLVYTEPETDILRLNALYRNAYACSRSKVFWGEGCILPTKSDDPQGSWPERSGAEVLQAVKNLSDDDFERALDSLLDGCRACGYEQAVKNCSALAGSIRKIGDAVTAGPGRADYYLTDFETISGFLDRCELEAWLRSLSRRAMLALTEGNNKKTYDIVADSITYIEANMGDPQLSINSMAERMSISAGYFSRIFNEVTGSSFPDYVTNLRLERACALLLAQRDSTISEIAQKVGYSSDSYFSSSFKKKYGVSPSKWRLSGAPPLA